MNLFVLLVAAVAAAVLMAYVATYLTRVIRDDGAHSPRRTPPASHHADAFDPRSRPA